jgi:uncharacterized protein YbjT (DUF2867 family)
LLSSSRHGEDDSHDEDVKAVDDQPQKSPPPSGSNKVRSYTRRKNKEQLMKAVGEEMKKQQSRKNYNRQQQYQQQYPQQKRESEEESSKRLLDQINPFKAGQSLRDAIVRGADEVLRQSKFYLSSNVDGSSSLAYDDLYDVTNAAVAGDTAYVPEVLVVGATGATGQLVVRQLLLRQCRVRVLVRDLYTATLNKLGTSVTYCQGDLLKPDTLEYATTDVDKIVFCANAAASGRGVAAPDDDDDDDAAAAKAAAQFAAIDEIGMKNLIHAYQNVRHADYGTQQAAKRVLFRFVNRIEDFYLFHIDTNQSENARWMRNKFDLGVFYGWGPAYLKSSRFQRSRDEPAYGIDFGPSYAGFVCKICADGETFEAVITANGEYEYTCSFSTRSKSQTTTGGTNKSRSKFMRVRLPFENFVCHTDGNAPPFDGRDIRYIGFRYNGKSGQRFFLSMDWVKLYRSQPEPEFVYLSDARIPRVVKHSMIQTEAKQLAINNEIRLYDDRQQRQPEATFYKFVGEEIVKRSGLAYSIIRVHGLTDGAADASAISLLEHPPSFEAPVSRADVAQICVQALLDPAALNKSFYVTPSNRPTTDNISRKLSLLPVDEVV